MEKENKAKKLGEKIKFCRKDKGITQGELGQALCYDRSLIAHFEAGDRNIDAVALFSMANYLEVDINEFNPF